MKKDYYQILEIHQQANEREIKIAYRRLAHEFHPDKNPNNKIAEDKFKEATEAYSVLIDPRKRARYDQFGHQGVDDANENHDSVDLEDIFGDIFGNIFGNKRNRNRSEKGTDLRFDLLLSFEEAVFGVEQKIKIKCKEKCTVCNGSGCKQGTQPIACTTCYETGEIRISQGFFSVTQTCHSCLGSGQLNKNPCIHCKGTRLQEVEKKLTITIQAGVDSNMKLRFPGRGNAGIKGGKHGDLFVALTVGKHLIFKRDGCDVTCDMPISFSQAVLGASIEIPTLYGKTILDIPAGTQTGTVFKLSGQGIPNLHSNSGKKGDQFVVITIEIPKKLSLDQEKALRTYADLADEDNLPSRKNFINKMRKLFK